MSDLLLGWMNDKLQLSSPINNFEADFSNGYLVGEILHRFNQQKNFYKFINKSTADAKINNWCLLSPTINALAIKFDSKMAYAIMCQQKGYASKLVYQVKMAIDKLSKTAPVAIKPKDSAVPLCNMPMKPQKPMFDQQGQKFFEKSVRMLVENPNDVMLARTQERFVQEKLRQEQMGAQIQRDEEDFLLMRNEDRRQMRLAQTKREHDYLQDWQAKGAEDWAINQAIANERQAKKMRAQAKVQQDRFDKQANSLYTSTTEMRQGIDDFEARLSSTTAKGKPAPLPPARRSNIIDGPETAEEVFERLQTTLPDSKTMCMEAEGFLNRVKCKSAETNELQAARGRRRRQFIAEQRDSQQESEEGRLMSLVQTDLLKGSCIEEQLGVDLWKINQYKSIIVENRNFREVQYAERRAEDHAEALERDSAACQNITVQHGEEVMLQQERYSEVLQAKEVAAHEHAKYFCSQVLGEVLDLALSMAHYREATNLFPAEFVRTQWEEMKRLFVAENTPKPDKEEPLFEIPPTGERIGVLNPLQLEDYLSNKGLWSPDSVLAMEDATKAVPIERPKTADPDAEEEDAKSKKLKGKGKAKGGKGKEAPAPDEEQAPVEPPSLEERKLGIHPEIHYDIGDLMQKIRLQAQPLDTPDPPPDVPQCGLCVCLYGQEYVGKSLHARNLAEKWGMSVIEVDELLRKAMKIYENEPEGGYPVSEPEIVADETEATGEDEGEGDSAAAEADAEAAPKGGEAAVEAADTDDKDVDAAAAEEEVEKEEEQEKEVDPNIALAAFSEVGAKISQLLRKGLAVEDDLYAQLVALQIKHYTDPEKGWILADFPETADQARRLEIALTGYDETKKLPSPSDRASKILPATPLPAKDPNEKLPSGIHLFFQMEGEKEELLHRALGRRVDPVTGSQYHLATAPPPEDEVCKERLQPVEVSAVTPNDAEKCMVDLSARLAIHDYGTKDLEDWVQQFGTLRRVDTLGLSEQEVFEILDAQVQELVDSRNSAELELQAKLQAQREESAAMEAEKVRVMAEAEEAVEKAKTNVEECKAVVTEHEEAVAAAPKGAEKKTAEAELASKQEVLAAAEGEVEAAEARVQAILDAELTAEKARLEALKPEPKVDDALAVFLKEQHDFAQDKLTDGMKLCFEKLGSEREAMVKHFYAATANFAQFVRRPDDKQAIIQTFQDSFNSIHQDMRFDDRTMEELHRRVDEVQNDLWDQTETREEQALAELEAIKTEGWVESHTKAMERTFQHMMQLEVDAAHTISSVLNTHYTALQNDGKLPLKMPNAEDEEEGESKCPDLPPQVADLYVSDADKAAADEAAAGKGKGKGKGKDAEEAFEPSPDDPYPALTITYMNALKCTGEAGVAEIKALGGTVEEEEPKGGGKAKGKDKGKGKGKDKGAEEEAPAELSEEAKVLQKRLATQNEILARRLRRLRKYGLATLDELQIFAQGVYAQFADAVSKRLEAEASCISALGAVARGAIEKKETLPLHLTVDQSPLYRFPYLMQLDQDTDLTLDTGLRLIPEEPAPEKPVVEQVDEQGVVFSPDQLADLRAQLEALVVTGGAGSRRCDMVVTRTRFADAMHRFACDDIMLPHKWQEQGAAAWKKLAELFDNTGTGGVNCSEVMEAVTSDAAGILEKISA